MPTEATDPRAFRSAAFAGAHTAVRREQASFREMLKTYRAPDYDERQMARHYEREDGDV